MIGEGEAGYFGLNRFEIGVSLDGGLGVDVEGVEGWDGGGEVGGGGEVEVEGERVGPGSAPSHV